MFYEFMEQLFDFFGLVIDTTDMTYGQFYIFTFKYILAIFIIKKIFGIVDDVSKIGCRGV